MPVRGLSTAKLAKAAGIHPNTVRLYEQWGYIPPASRSPAGYRQFTPQHLNCLRLARLVMSAPWAGRPIRHSAVQIVLAAAGGELEKARALAGCHLDVVHGEQAHAEEAAQALERWAGRLACEDEDGPRLRIGDAARRLGLTVDILHNWEKNGLVAPPRDPSNRYRLYGRTELDRLQVIRMLLRAGYSTMAVLRLLLELDAGETGDVRQVLDTPRPDEEVLSAADRWISALAEQEARARQIIRLLDQFEQGN